MPLISAFCSGLAGKIRCCASGQNAPKAAVPQGLLAVMNILTLLVFAVVFC
ncbi:MAG: hypothetical protein J0H75_10270 [Rhizobiales bacterium]|nr:hypothetical protein [Hyphomicrobiales bacterium]